MNIVFISSLYPTQPGDSGENITRALHNLVKYWNRTEKVLVIRPVYVYARELFAGKQRPTRKILHIDDVTVMVYPIYKIPKIAYFYYPLYRCLDRYLKRSGIKPDLVVAHYDKSLNIGNGYARRRNLPLTAGLHSTPDLMDDEPTAFHQRCGKILEAAALIACRSTVIYNKVAAWYPQYQEKSFIAYSGIEEHLSRGTEFAIDKLKQWKPGGKISILTVSSLIEVKKIDTNLGALSRLNDQIDWTYTIVGDGEKRQHLEKLAEELGIRQRVRFKGALPRQEAIEEMERSHIFVMVSRLESFGLVYLEAMATGNIVIGGKGEGIDGVIRDGENGFLSPPAQPEPLTHTLEEIILRKPRETLESILKEAQHTLSQYTDTKAAQNYLEHLHCLRRQETLSRKGFLTS